MSSSCPDPSSCNAGVLDAMKYSRPVPVSQVYDVNFDVRLGGGEYGEVYVGVQKMSGERHALKFRKAASSRDSAETEL